MNTTKNIRKIVSLFVLILGLLFGCNPGQKSQYKLESNEPFLVILGIAQDAGFPQAGMKQNELWEDPTKKRYATCLALIDPLSKQRWMFEATPDFKYQLHELDKILPVEGIPGLTGIFLTHAHVGHYTGLIHIGHEIIGGKKVPVHAMPRMHEFLSANGPWDQLVRYENIELRKLTKDKSIQLNPRLSVTPFLVPHRDEYSETVGFRIQGPNRSVIFIPDINKWEILDEWGIRIEDLISQVDVALLDGSFFADGEVPGRVMSEIPHPFISESMDRFSALPEQEIEKIKFIHLNRTNPALFEENIEFKEIKAKGFGLAKELERIRL